MDMPVYLTYFIQLLLVIHVLKTGRERMWIFILLFLPLVGGAAYLILEVLPGFMGGVRGQKAARGVMQLVDPGGDIRACEKAWAQSANADNGRRYAQALINANKPNEALDILAKAREGFFKNDPTLLLLEAQARFMREEWDQSLDALTALKAENPDFQSAEGHLLEARALEAAGRTDEAISAYHAVSQYFPGAEARYRLAVALESAGHSAEARLALEELVKDAELAPAHFRKSQRSWIKAAKEALKSIDKTG